MAPPAFTLSGKAPQPMKASFSPVTLSGIAIAHFVGSAAPARVSSGPSAQSAGSAMAAGSSRGPVNDLGRKSEGFAPVAGWFARGIRLPAIEEALDDVFGG